MHPEDLTASAAVEHAALAAVRAWVHALPPATAFWCADIPAALREAGGEACTVLDGDWPVAWRIEGEFCWRASCDDTPARVEVCRRPAWIAIACAGAGAGYAGYSAVRRLGWTTQIPARDLLATVVGAPQLALEGVRYAVPAENLRRRELTWAETTLLEALLHADLIDADPSWHFDPDPVPWDHAAWASALSLLASGETLRRLGPGAVLRLDVLEWVAGSETDPCGTLRGRLRDIGAVIGSRAEHPTATRRVNYAAPQPWGDPFRIPLGVVGPSGRSAAP